MSDTEKNIFDLEDLDSQEHPHLNAFVTLPVYDVTVEFLQQGSPKPHVVFHVNSDRPITAADDNGNVIQIKGCLLSMDYAGVQNEGIFLIKLLTYHGPSFAASAAFQFPLRTNRSTILDWINIFRGQHPRLPVGYGHDMTDFDFTLPNPPDPYFDGCRDFVTQCFIRLHVMGIIEWNASGQGVEGIRMVDFNVHVPTNGFHHIIPHNYKVEDDNNSQGRRGHGGGQQAKLCYIYPLPLNRGDFLDSQVRRHETYTVNGTLVQMPYVPMPSASGGGPSGSGPPAGGPSGGSSGRGYNQGDPRSQHPGYPSGSSAGAGRGYPSGSRSSGQGRQIPGAYGYNDSTLMSSRQGRDRVALTADKSRPSRQVMDQRQKDTKGPKDTKAGTGSRFGSLFSRSKHVDEAAAKSHHPVSKSHVSSSSKPVNSRLPNEPGGHITAARLNSQDPRHHDSRQPNPGSYPVGQRSTNVRPERVTANPPSGLVHRYKDTKPDPRAQGRSRNDQYSSATSDTKDPKYATDPRYARDPKYITDPRYAAKPAPYYSSSSNHRDRVQY